MIRNKSSTDYHKPKHVKLKDATNVVIFIHGIVEGPGQFLRLMEVTYNSGYSAASLLLPGHGGQEEILHKAAVRNGLSM